MFHWKQIIFPENSFKLQGQCYEMFRAIVYEKFKEQFKRSGQRPAIDIRTNLLWSNWFWFNSSVK